MKKKKDTFVMMALIICFFLIFGLTVLVAQSVISINDLNDRVDEYVLELAKFDAEYTDFGEQVVSVLQQHSYILAVLVDRSQQLEDATGIELVPFENG